MKMIEDIEKDFLGAFKVVLKSYGLDDLCAEVTGLLYLSPCEMSMEELVKKTGYSNASICNTLKALNNMRMVERIKKPGTKKAFFYMEKDILRLNLRKLSSIRDNMIKPIKNMMPEIIEKHKNKADKKKIRIIEDYSRQISSFENIINDWIKTLSKVSKDEKRHHNKA